MTDPRDTVNIEVLKTYKTLIDGNIAVYSEKLKQRWEREYGLDTADVFDAYLSILSRGGKRLRGALGMWSYFVAGGEDEGLALQLARILEMTHAYLLVADDIADGALLRRSGPSAHKLLENWHGEQSWFGDSHHFGTSQAMNASLAAMHHVIQEVAEMPVSDNIKLEALRELNLTLTRTVAGQIADINHEVIRDIEESEVVKMMLHKTAYYSFVNPLQLGIIFAGDDFAEYKWLEDWARNIGLSFQIQDDILGLFGDESKTGKSSLDDVREGKITLLIIRALAHANESQKAQLLSILGNPNMNDEDLETVQKIVEDTGSLDYSRKLMDTYAQRAIVVLYGASDIAKEKAAFLESLSRTITTRSS